MFVEIYNLANVSSVPINRFGFFVLAVASMCLFVRIHRAALDVADVTYPRPPQRQTVG
jgi:hypothetical protein